MTLVPSPVPSEPDQGIFYTVTEGVVGRTMSFTAAATWESVPLGRNAAQGIVTSVDVSGGGMVEVGSTLYSVNLRPTSAAQGAIPAFRDLSEGTRGADVQQLQAFLAAVGHYGGALDGVYGSTTIAAVRAWQQRTGVQPDGVIRQGDLLYFPDLPVRIRPASDLQVGAVVSTGQVVIDALPRAPTFTITLSIEQADLIPLVTSVVVHHAEGTWTGRISSTTTGAMGELVLTLEGENGEPLCGDECELVPIAASALYTADLIAVPDTRGPVVPVSALRTAPDGTVSVITEDGEVLPVTIRAAAQGRAVVAGISPGARVRLFAGDGGAPTAEPAEPAPPSTP